MSALEKPFITPEQYLELERKAEFKTDYLLVSQDVMRVKHFIRQGDNQWLLTVHHGPEALVKIASVNCELRLADVYLKVQICAERNAPILRIVNNSH